MFHFPPWAWAAFLIFTGTLLALDLWLFRKHDRDMSIAEASGWCVGWFALAMLFNGFVLWKGGSTAGMEWFTCYLVEICLSVDNLFVFILVFSYFKVASHQQHRVLFWGILGAAAMRALFIFAGIGLISKFDKIVFLFGAFLVFTGIKLAIPKKEDEAIHPENNFAVKLARKIFPYAPPDGDRFFSRHQGKLGITPLFIVLLVIESTDLAFAVDSIPAVIAITKDTFIAFTSNIFAVLGLRALYFALRGVMGLFRFLNFGLAMVLTFIGTKMLIADIYHVDTMASLLVIGGILGASIAASLLLPEKKQP